MWGKLGVTVDGNVFDTDGYAIVRENERGRVDNNAAARFWNLNAKLDYAATDRVARVRHVPATSTRTATTARRARSTAPKKPTTRRGAP